MKLRNTLKKIQKMNQKKRKCSNKSKLKKRKGRPLHTHPHLIALLTIPTIQKMIVKVNHYLSANG